MHNTRKMKGKIAFLSLMILVVTLFVYDNSFAQGQANEEVNVGGGEIVSTVEATVCCGKTKSGLFCQDVKEEECAENPIPTACSSTSMCRPGWCLDDKEGTCMDGVASSVCNTEGGQWFAEKPPVCELGCCILGDQASYVTLPRCKALSSTYGIETNWDMSYESEPACILAASAQEKGACVFVEDFEKTCKFVTRGECTVENVLKKEESQQNQQNTEQQETDLGLTSVTNNENQNRSNDSENGRITGQVVSGLENNTIEFFAGKLCSAPELQTNCGPTRETICVPGRQEVYFKDSCGNPTNIYDASKVSDVNDYWANIKKKEESCNVNNGNENSQTCGNCNYLSGSYCRAVTSETANPTYGNFVCASLNCEDPVTGKERLHGESWCGFDNLGLRDKGRNPVGSKFYRYQCNNGEVVIEPCADFRQEECIENVLETSLGKFSEAACRVNRWQDCTAQRDSQACLNSDKRDCIWLEGIEYVLMGAVLNDPSANGNGTSSSFEQSGGLAGIQQRAKQTIKEAGGIENIPRGACVPKNPPGLKFWEGQEAANICFQANAVCPVTYERRKFGGGEWECIENCECLAKDTELKRTRLCIAMGDCGLNINFVGQVGNNKGYKITEQELGGD